MGSGISKPKMLNIYSKIGKYEPKFSICTLENLKGTCYCNVVLISLFNCDIFNKLIEKFLYKHENLKLIQLIEAGDNIYESNKLVEYSHNISIYINILIMYYAAYVQACKFNYVSDIYITKILSFIMLLSLKYFGGSKYFIDYYNSKLQNLQVRTNKNLRVVPAALRVITVQNVKNVDEVNDYFVDYYNEFDEYEYNENSGGEPIWILLAFLEIFNRIPKYETDIEKKTDIDNIYKLFISTYNENKHLIISLKTFKDRYNINYKFGKILIVANKDYLAMGYKSDLCNIKEGFVKNIKIKEFNIILKSIGISDVELIKYEMYYPQNFITKLGKKYILSSKTIHSNYLSCDINESIENMHVEVIVRCHDTGEYFRISDETKIKCDENNSFSMDYNSLGYIHTCNSKCFDDYVSFAVYVEED